MGFHCGNTCSSCMKQCKLNYQVIMNRLMEDGKKPDITRGTLEGQIKPGPITMFPLEGRVAVSALPVPRSAFGQSFFLARRTASRFLLIASRISAFLASCS